MAIPEELEIFTKKLRWNTSGSSADRMLLDTDRVLSDALDIEWQNINNAHSGLLAVEDKIGLVVRGLFRDFQASDDSHEYAIVKRYWLSFLSKVAIEVASSRYQRLGLKLEDVKYACINGFIDRQVDFFKGYKDEDADAELLTNLRNYSFVTIKNLGYGYLRILHGDRTIGRTNRGLITKFPEFIARALKYRGVNDPTIDRDIRLCATLSEYLRHENIRIDRVRPTHDFNTFRRLYCQVYPNCNDLPASIYDRLDFIGDAIRKFIKREVELGDLSLDRQISANKFDNSDTPTVGDMLGSDRPTPQEVMAESEDRKTSQRIIPACDLWISNNLTARDKKILCLRYYFNLGQELIELIVVLDQAGVCRRLREINTQLKDSLIDEFRAGNNRIFHGYVIEAIVEMFKKDWQRLQIGTGTGSESYRRLDRSIAAYKQYFGYLKRLKREHRSLIPELSKIGNFVKKLEYLDTLSQEHYPKLNPELTSASFLRSIEDIQDILASLWN